MKIEISVRVDAPLSRVWECWTQPKHIVNWNFASDDWRCPTAVNDIRSGGSFSWRMEAKDGSMGFDFEGTYTTVEPQELIEYELGDGRNVKITFATTKEGVLVTEIFEAEKENTAEMQKQGWQAILGNFKEMVENRG